MLLKLTTACRLRNEDGTPTTHDLANGKYLEGRFRKFVDHIPAWRSEGHRFAWNVYVIGSGLLASNSKVGFVPDEAVTVINGTVDVRYGMATGGGVVGIERCAYCDHAAAAHVLPQSTESKAAMVTLRNWLLTGPSSRRQGIGQKMMLGVLTATGSAATVTYASNSGGVSEKVREAAQACGFVYAPPIRPNNIFDVANLPRGVLNRCNEAADNGKPGFIQNFDYQCAAPNMIQKALYDGHTITAMTEAFFGTGDTQPSCTRCQQTVPFMLCHAPRPSGLVWPV